MSESNFSTEPGPFNEAAFITALARLDNSIDDVQIRIDDREVAIHGSVRSFFDKQIVQETIRQVDRHCRINNKLHVAR